MVDNPEKPTFFESIKNKIYSLRNLRRNLNISHVGDLSRRYFVMNAFDGVMTMLGFIIGAHVSGLIEPRIVVAAGLGASLAMGISGFFGAYLAEKALRIKKLKEIEKNLFTNLNGSVLEEASKFAMIWLALVDGASPAIAAMISISPFILALFNIVNVELAIVSSVFLSLSILFLLGTYLGRISKESMIKYGLFMAAAGIITLLISMLLGGPQII